MVAAPGTRFPGIGAAESSGRIGAVGLRNPEKKEFFVDKSKRSVYLFLVLVKAVRIHQKSVQKNFFQLTTGQPPCREAWLFLNSKKALAKKVFALNLEFWPFGPSDLIFENWVVGEKRGSRVNSRPIYRSQSV